MEKKQKLVWFAKRCALALAVAALCYLLFGVIVSTGIGKSKIHSASII